ncbi:unnamed protein product, partial [Porites evermanni]
VNATCQNTVGSYKCTCKAGYWILEMAANALKSTSVGAKPITVTKNALCKNTEGSFTCTCNRGFKGDGKKCRDIDECTSKIHNCDRNALCKNTEGSFTCTCKPGYKGDGKKCKGKYLS